MSGVPTLLWAQATTRTYYEVARLSTFDEWWHWLAFLGTTLALVALIVFTYRRDSVELPRPTRWLLLGLRLAAFAGLMIFFLQIEKRSERKLTKTSRAVVLVDTSQSMGLRDTEAAGQPNGTSRLEQVVQTLQDEPFVASLRANHDVVVYQFDRDERPAEIATLTKRPVVAADATAVGGMPAEATRSEARGLFLMAATLLVLSAVATALHLFVGLRGQEGESWGLLAAMVSFICALVTVAVLNLRHPGVTPGQLLGRAPSSMTAPPAPETEDREPAESPQLNWAEMLMARGGETRLGDALSYIVDKERGGPIAGIAVFTDGNQNAGSDVRDAVAVAAEAEIAIFPVGLGTDQRPKNLRVVDVEAPQRVYPGDAFKLTGYLQAYGLTGQSVKVELVESDLDSQHAIVQEERRIQVGEDGEITTVEFEIVPEELGRRRYMVRTSPPPGDLDQRDNQRHANVQIVDRKNHVLLLAGGPTREYRFVRNLCFRDKDTTVDVLLQSSPKGAAQEADTVLVDLPTTADEMFAYDCLLAFDPNWDAFSDVQLELLDRWVAEKAGGIIMVAGPVFMPELMSQRRETRGLKTIKALFPVLFYSRSSIRMGRDQFGSTTAWPLKFTESGLAARFLWLDDTATRSQQAWDSLAGVYGYYPVRGTKPGATVYSYFADPQTAIDNQLPVYMAEQFYGSGRVFFLGSGEMWRLRAMGETYFEQFYTKLIRHVSEGRLLRDSSRGMLLVEQDRCVLGDTVIVRATLTDAQYRPLTDPSVEALLIRPDGERQPMKLNQQAETARGGSYAGQFTATLEGDYRIELPVPKSDDLELLTREVRVRVPDLEIENPQRNDATLSEIAAATGGAYFVGTGAAVAPGSGTSLSAALVPHDQETYLPGTPDREFQQRLMGWLMVLICGTLSLEWLLRRMNRLA